MAQYAQLNAVISEAQFGQRLDQALAKLFPDYSRSQIKKWILSGYVKINGKIVNFPRKKVFGNESISMQAKIKENICWEAQDIPLNIIYEDEHILVINKPRNLVMHPGPGNPDGTMLNALLHYYPAIANVPRFGIVQRLDKDTTGLLVAAKTNSAQANLVEALQLRKIRREYEAIVIGNVDDDGAVNEPISRHRTKRTNMTVHPMGKYAITHYYVIEYFHAHTHLRLRLETGRTHQIRVHMAHINHPLVGDPLYGGKPCRKKGASEILISTLRSFDRQALHSIILRLYHPITGIEMEWYAPLPQDMMNLINVLKKDTGTFERADSLTN